ncbi:glycoside hydrolase superfamily [Phycomyces nitens]|nr:glycoside hydrolase superfamily [Phycomyces nitens]
MAEDFHFLHRDSMLGQTFETSSDTMPNVLIIINVTQLPVELQDGVLKVMKHAPRNNIVNGVVDCLDNDYQWHTSFIYDQNLRPGELVVNSNRVDYVSSTSEDFQICIRYNRRIEAFRALGRLLGAARDSRVATGKHGLLLNFTEQAQFETQGVMVDCSRNGVLRVHSVYFILCNMAYMGLNMLQLYTEDTYEVEGEPLFGYLRGKYTQEELSAIDDYAFDLGIEVMPCIQTLGHFGQVLQWPEYAHLRDNPEVLLAESEPTYDFLEKIIKAAASPFRSKRIHLGMDEAHGLGEGRYAQIFGYKEPTKIFVDHLKRVHEICARLGIQPILWSDMLFCLAARNNTLQGYYDESSNPATPELVESMPNNTDLIYWDYYHTNPDIYEQKLKQHRDLGCHQPWVATGVWTWSRFWSALPFTFEAVRASTVTAKDKDHGVRNTFITIWGDEGNECDIYSALPAMCYYAHHGYSSQDEIDISLLKLSFEGICGASFDDWVFASKIDDTPTGIPITQRTHYAPNTSKWLLWEDPFLSFLSPQYADEDLENHYRSISEHLFDALESKRSLGPLNLRLEFPARIATVLSLKCHLRQRLADAYRKQQYEQLYDLAQGRLTRLREEVDHLWKYHRQMWMKMYKPFGWEVLELRYGGLRTRLETMYDQIMAHVEYVMTLKDSLSDSEILENEHARIEEFEVDLKCVFLGSRTNLLLDYSRAATPSRHG